MHKLRQLCGVDLKKITVHNIHTEISSKKPYIPRHVNMAYSLKKKFSFVLYDECRDLMRT